METCNYTKRAAVNIQSWMIKSWATHEWYLPPQAEQLPHFKHVGTQVRDDGSATGLRAGDTVWMSLDEQWQVGLAWEWVEIKPGMVMLADPNSIITNLQFVDEHQKSVYGLAKTVAVNRLVHALAWQSSVCALLQPAAEQAGAACAAAPARRHSDGAHLGSRPLGAQRTPASGHLIRPNHSADLHAIQSRARWATAEQPRRLHSRATDREEPVVESTVRPNLRRAA